MSERTLFAGQEVKCAQEIGHDVYLVVGMDNEILICEPDEEGKLITIEIGQGPQSMEFLSLAISHMRDHHIYN